MSGLMASRNTAIAQQLRGATDDEKLMAAWIHDKAPKTQKMYSSVLASFFGYVNVGIREVTLEDIYTWIDAIAPNLKPATIKSKLYVVKSLLSFSHKLGYTQFNVGAVVKPPKVAANVHRKFLMPEQIKKLADSVNCVRDGLLIRLGFFSACRASELAGLTWGCLRNDVITFWVSKTQKNHSVKLPREIVDALNDFKPYNATEDTPIFQSRKGGSLDRRSITAIVKAAAKKAGFSDKVSAHWLRHSHVFAAIEAGVPLATIRDTCAHASFATTSVYSASLPGTSSAMALSL